MRVVLVGALLILALSLVLTSSYAVGPSAGEADPADDPVSWFLQNVVVELGAKWVSYIKATFQENPGHVIVEAIAIIIIITLLLQRTYDPGATSSLSPQEAEQLIKEWKPEPLAPPVPKKVWKRIAATQILASATEKGIVKGENGKDYHNFASYSFAGIGNHKEIKDVCEQTIKKYGVGSCGPRGFYGTIDVHLKLEEEFAKWIGAEDAILYSDGIACLSSVIPAFSKKEDLIICDEGVNHNIRSGIELSKSSVLYFKHNDIAHLEQLLNQVAEKDKTKPFKALNRRFIITEGLFQNKGDLCPLNEIVQLKKKYKYRLILDDSMAVGVYGKSGRGSPDHWGIDAKEVDILCCTLDASISSVGGICAGSKEIVDHQRLSGVGYVFSASSPPYTCTAALKGMEILDREPQRFVKVRANAKKFRKLLKTPSEFVVDGDIDSPIVLIRLNGEPAKWDREIQSDFFESLGEFLSTKHNILVGVSTYIPQEKKRPMPSLRVLITAEHSDANIELVADRINKSLKECLTSFSKSLEESPEEKASD